MRQDLAVKLSSAREQVDAVELRAAPLRRTARISPAPRPPCQGALGRGRRRPRNCQASRGAGRSQRPDPHPVGRCGGRSLARDARYAGGCAANRSSVSRPRSPSSTGLRKALTATRVGGARPLSQAGHDRAAPADRPAVRRHLDHLRRATPCCRRSCAATAWTRMSIG